MLLKIKLLNGNDLKMPFFLIQLQNDGLKITTEEMIHLLLAVDEKLKTVDTIAEKTLAEIRIHTDKCKRELDEHTERRKLALDRERDYEQSCEGTSIFIFHFKSHISHIQLIFWNKLYVYIAVNVSQLLIC